MSRFLATIMTGLFLAVLPVSGAKPVAQTKNPIHRISSELPADEEMTYASISRTNPFEIVPAAGMSITDEISDDDMSLMADDMIAFAKKYIGTRYVRGGKSPKGFDCSGFTGYVFSQFGYSLAPSSSAQYGQGTKIDRSEISKGDLLFFTGRNSRSGRVGHVGIAIDNDPVTGEITFIHAATSGGIRIDRTSAPYYANRFIGARRVL